MIEFHFNIFFSDIFINLNKMNMDNVFDDKFID
jgi:hypothetical protein